MFFVPAVARMPVTHLTTEVLVHQLAETKQAVSIVSTISGLIQLPASLFIKPKDAANK